MSGRPDWGVLLLALAALAAFIVLHTKPISEMADRNHVLLMERLKQLPSDYKEFGKNIANLEDQHDNINVLNVQADDARSDIEMLKQWNRDLEVWLKAVDTGGSRRWIGSAKE